MFESHTLHSYKVKAPQFEGPLHVLLELIESRKLFVNEISLATVTEDFITYTESIRGQGSEYPLGMQSEFVVIASTLLLIKSRSLLPGFTLTEEEQHVATDLETRLKLLQVFKHAAEKLGKIANKKPLFAPIESTKVRYAGFVADPTVTTESLLEALRIVLMRVPAPKETPTARVEKVISLEEMMTHLADRINNAIKMSFSHFTQSRNAPKKEVIVGFLAMLELVKRGVIIANQDNHFDEITIEKQGVDVPRYA